MTVYILIDDTQGRTLAEYGEDGAITTLAFLDRKAAHDYRNRHGLPGHLRPQAIAPDHLDRAAAASLERYGEPAGWRLVTDRSQAPALLADRIDPQTGEVVERCLWGEYYNLDWIWTEVQRELYA